MDFFSLLFLLYCYSLKIEIFLKNCEYLLLTSRLLGFSEVEVKVSVLSSLESYGLQVLLGLGPLVFSLGKLFFSYRFWILVIPKVLNIFLWIFNVVVGSYGKMLLKEDVFDNIRVFNMITPRNYSNMIIWCHIMITSRW